MNPVLKGSKVGDRGGIVSISLTLVSCLEKDEGPMAPSHRTTGRQAAAGSASATAPISREGAEKTGHEGDPPTPDAQSRHGC